MTTSERGLEIIIKSVLEKIPEITTSRYPAIREALHPHIDRDVFGRPAIEVTESTILELLCHLFKTRPALFKEPDPVATPLERLKAANAGKKVLPPSPAPSTKKLSALDRLKAANRGQH